MIKLREKAMLALLLVILAVLGYGTANVQGGQRSAKQVSAVPGDTSTELQKLFDLNKENKYNLVVKIPAGTYELYKELRIYSNTTVEADKAAVMMKLHKRGALLANDLSKDKGGFSASENITVIGGRWDSKKVADDVKGTESFRFIHASNITIKNAVICNVPDGSHLITFAGVKNGVIEGCTLYGYRGTRPKEAIQLDIVHDAVIVPSMQANLIKYDDQPCDGIIIRNNEIYNFPRAIGSHTSVDGVFHKNITITGNNLHDLLEAGIKAYNYVNTEISDNIIKNAGLGILAYTSIANEEGHFLKPLSTTKKEPLPKNYKLVIKNNKISDIKIVNAAKITAWGDGIRIIGNKKRPITGVVLEKNTITSTGRYGIFVEGAPACKTVNNQIYDTVKNAIYLINGSNNSIISDNLVNEAGKKGSSTDGIGLLASAKVSIKNNKINAAARNGIFIFDACKESSVSDNTVKGAGEHGIAVYKESNDSTVSGNTLSSYKKHGIFIYEATSGTLQSNTITGGAVSQDGIHITGNSNSKKKFIVKKNMIKKAGRFGVFIEKAPGVQVISNTISNTVDRALYLGNGCNNSKEVSNIVSNTGNKKQ